MVLECVLSTARRPAPCLGKCRIHVMVQITHADHGVLSLTLCRVTDGAELAPQDLARLHGASMAENPTQQKPYDGVDEDLDDEHAPKRPAAPQVLDDSSLLPGFNFVIFLCVCRC